MKLKGFFGRAIAVLLTCTMLMPAALNAATFTDSAGHWAETQIEYMVQKKVLSGYPDGTFLPNNPVTRAEFIKMIDDTFGLVGTQGLTYTDVKSTDWYYTYIAKAVKQGYILDYGRKVNPNEQIYREEAAALIARYLELPEEEAVSKNKFSDYNRIDADYRDYVLQAAYAGLINGYPDGTFGPKNTLTRAEALAMLSRAAGSIFDATATGLDKSATQGNAVVTKPNVTVRNAEIDGNMIITEGANTGTVTLSKCIIDGALYIRGTSRVILSECEIEELIVDTGAKTALSMTLEDDTYVGEMTFVSPAGVNAKKGTIIDEITVTEGATASSVSGEPEIGKLTVNAARFTTTVTPEEYEVADGLSATIGGNSTSGAAEDNTGFTKEPTASVKSSYDYLSFTASANGYVYYYYTNTATAPAASDFAKLYSSVESMKGRFSVKKGEAEEEKAKATANASGYTYMVVCFADSSEKYYKPVIIKRAETTSGYGFSGTPTITMQNGMDYLNAVPLNTSKLYYYYTSTSTAPAATQFMNVYATATYKNMINTTANTTISQPLASTATVSAYNYVVIMAIDAKGNNLTPMIIKRGSTGISATSSGFYAAPSITENMGYDYITLNATTTGNIYYYYSTSPTAPDTTTFTTTYQNTSSSYKGSISVTTAMQNVSKQHPYARPAQTTYPYMVFMMQDSSGTYYTPYVATRGSTNNITSTGFTTTPTVTSMGAYDYISVVPLYAGKIQLYYTTSSTTPTPAEFASNFSIYMSNSSVPTAQQNVTAGQDMSGQLNGYTNVASYTHVVFMFTDSSNRAYQPVVVARTNTNTSIATSGFAALPTVYASSDYDGKDTINVSVSTLGYVYYYYTNTYSLPDSSTFMNNFYLSSCAGQEYIAQGTKSFTSSQTSASMTNNGYRYVVFMFTQFSMLGTSTPSTPVIVARSNMSSSSGSTSTTSSGFSVSPRASYDRTGGQDYLTFTSSKTCEMYFYYTDSKTSATTAVDFWAEYYSADIKGTYDVKAGQDTSRSISSSGISGYNYIMVMLVDGSTSYKPYPVERK